MKKKMIIVIAILALVLIGAGVVYAQSKCVSCAGHGTSMCRPCTGTGRIATGYVTDPLRNTSQRTYETCTPCNGTGRVACWFCKGTGQR